MNCKQFCKYAGAFADGELDVPFNAEALEHLRMCPRCAGRVAEVTNLKAALKRTLVHESAPPHLRQRVMAALDDEVGVRGRKPAGPAIRAWRSRLVVVTGVAASLVLASLAWWLLDRREQPTDSLTIVSGRVVADVREQHRLCVSRRGLSHHDPRLPRDLTEIASRLSAELGLAVKSPNLSRYGFELVGADQCGIRGQRGAHVLYRRPSPPVVMLSVFTLPRLADLQPGEGDRTAEEAKYYVTRGDSPRLVAWHEGAQTYTVCADLPEADLLAIAGGIRGQRVTESLPLGRWYALATGRTVYSDWKLRGESRLLEPRLTGPRESLFNAWLSGNRG